jgi:hypothetical protein
MRRPDLPLLPMILLWVAIALLSAGRAHAAQPVKECHLRTAREGVPIPDGLEPAAIPSLGYRCTAKDGTQYDQLERRYEIVTAKDGEPAVLARPPERDQDLRRFGLRVEKGGKR